MKSSIQHLLFLTFLLPLTFASCSDTNGDDDWKKDNSTANNLNCNDTSKEPALSRLEFPKVKGGSSLVLIHTTSDNYGINYSVEWDYEKMAQRWSCYQMNGDLLKKNASRSSSGYAMDPLLSSNQYLDDDYFYGSGFDHGHICPSADRLYSTEANEQTFYLTNMQPQYKAFNGSLTGSEKYKNEWSPWYRLEAQVRTWAGAVTTENLYVVKGGTIEDNQIIKKISGKLIVPKYFFVALLLKNAEGYKAIGFWMEHVSSYSQKDGLGSYAVNIRELEQKTGIDFFCNLPDDIEEHVETLPVENLKRAWGL